MKVIMQFYPSILAKGERFILANEEIDIVVSVGVESQR
jgi:hypothetical protein